MEDNAEIAHRAAAAPSYTETPGQHITINQLVAHNLAYWRRVAGLTQEELGEILGGWSKATVSAAERSWDGKRIRQFDADELMALAFALDVPLAALFMPPEGDGIDMRYIFHTHDASSDCHDMHDLFVTVMSDPSDDPTPVMNRYRDRYTSSLNFYLDPGRGEELAQYLEDLTTEERIEERLTRVREQYVALRSVVSDLDRMQEALGERLHELKMSRQISRSKGHSRAELTP